MCSIVTFFIVQNKFAGYVYFGIYIFLTIIQSLIIPNQTKMEGIDNMVQFFPT